MVEEITRERMREAIKIAKRIIDIGKKEKVDVTEAERLLGEALGASYRLDYLRALHLAEAAQHRVITDAQDEARQAGFESGREQGQLDQR